MIMHNASLYWKTLTNIVIMQQAYGLGYSEKWVENKVSDNNYNHTLLRES